MEVIVSATPQQTAADALSALLVQYAARPVLLLLSGGSALSFLDLVQTDVVGPLVTVTVLDERFSTDPAVNNFAQLEQTAFYGTCVARGACTLSTLVIPGDRLADLAGRFESALHTWKKAHPDGVVITTMGIGTDGHTAGILPGAPASVLAGGEWVIGYTVPVLTNPFTERVTVTATFLRTMVDAAVVFALGETKRAYIERIQHTECSLAEIPAAVLCDMSFVQIVTDGV